MSSSDHEFSLYAKAERRLYEEAGPVLCDLFHKIELELGVHMTELRVIFQRQETDERGVTANCTIVSAKLIQAPDQK